MNIGRAFLHHSSPVRRRQDPLPPFIHQKLSISPGRSRSGIRTQILSIPSRRRSGSRLRLSESQRSPTRRRPISRLEAQLLATLRRNPDKVLPPSPGGSSRMHDTAAILAKNLQIIEPTPTRGAQSTNGSGSGKHQAKGQGQHQGHDSQMGVISVQDIIALADAISRLRNDRGGQNKTGIDNGAKLATSKGSDKSGQSKEKAKAKTEVGNAMGQQQASQAVILADASGSSVVSPPVFIADSAVVTVDSIPGLVSLGPPGITEGVHIPTSSSGTSITEIVAPLALLQRNEHERRNLVNHLIADPTFMTELLKTAHNKNVPIDITNIATLIRNGMVDTGNSEQNSMINGLVEATYKNMLEEMLENVKQRLMKQVEAQLENKRPDSHRQAVIITHV